MHDGIVIVLYATCGQWNLRNLISSPCYCSPICGEIVELAMSLLFLPSLHLPSALRATNVMEVRGNNTDVRPGVNYNLNLGLQKSIDTRSVQFRAS